MNEVWKTLNPNIANPVLGIVIPTRNRPELAIASAESALAGRQGEDALVVISDNSTDPAASAQLVRYASERGRDVCLIRPDSPLGMAAHWSFAVAELLRRWPVTHVTILTDRMVFKKGAVERLLAVVRDHPGDILSFTYDRVNDATDRVVYRPLPRSGDLRRIPAGDLLAMSARMAFPSCLPRMLNCVASRSHLEAMQSRYGATFNSIAPDFNFCYTTLLAVPSILFLDRSLLVNYAQARSNGASFTRGLMTQDSKDFLANVGASTFNSRSPLPSIHTVVNAIVHEYEYARGLSGGEAMPPIDRSAYLSTLAAELEQFVDRANASEAMGVLKSAGWRPSLSYLAGRAKAHAINVILSLRSRPFASSREALDHAMADTQLDWKWFPHPALKYGTHESGS